MTSWIDGRSSGVRVRVPVKKRTVTGMVVSSAIPVAVAKADIDDNPKRAEHEKAGVS